MMDKVRVHEIAKELGINSKEVVDKAAIMGLNVKTASSTVSMEEAEKIMNYIMGGAAVETNAPKVSPVEIASEAPVIVVGEEPKTQDMVETVGAVSPIIVEEPVVMEVVPPKRTGLKIVKKKRPVEEVAVVAPSRKDPVNVSQYGKLSEQAQRELEAKRAKKSQHSSPTMKKDQGVRLDIFSGGISDISMDYEDEQVVLLDFSDLNAALPPEEVQKPKEKKPIGRNAGKKQGANRGKPRQVSRESRKKYTKDAKEDEVITHVEIPEDVRVHNP